MNKRDTSKAARQARNSATDTIAPVPSAWTRLTNKNKPRRGKRRVTSNNGDTKRLLNDYIAPRSKPKKTYVRTVFGSGRG